MHHLVSSNGEETKKQQHMLEKFDKLTRQHSNSVRDLVTLAAQIVRPQPEGDLRGYWSNPEDQVIYMICSSSYIFIQNCMATYILQNVKEWLVPTKNAMDKVRCWIGLWILLALKIKEY